MGSGKHFFSIQHKVGQDFLQNLAAICEFMSKSGKNAFVCAPEVALSGFCYQRMLEASEFSKKATEELLDCTAKFKNTLVITMIEQKNKKFYNNLKVFHKGEVIHKQSKHKLFALGDEQLHFKAGSADEIAIFELDGVRCAALICFELRFIELWDKIRGADVIFIPAQWAEARKVHFEVLSHALAIANQAFVIASNGANTQMAKGSQIITPYGIAYKNDKKSFISYEADLKEVSKMRKYINTGIKP